MGLYEDWLAEQGMSGNTGTGEMPWYTEEHAFGSDLHSEAGDPLQGYGTSDLWNIYEGIQHLFGLQDTSGMGGGAYGADAGWYQAMQPEAYDMEKSGESLLRDAYSEDYKGYKLSQQDLTESYKGQQVESIGKMAKAGFAGGGRAARGVGTQQDKFLASTRAQQEGWAASQVGYKKDILGARQKYVGDLWDRYMIFTSALDAEEVAPTDPTGEYDTGWDWWSATYG